MGVPKFYRWISERYPCLSEVVKDYQIPEFDNLYLDMNGIIHVCSHPEDDNPHFRITEEKIFQDIFHYIEVLFRMIKPRKVFFMAVDGVAPRAKMNQQRGRRFRSAREAEMLVRKAVEKGETLPTEARFDSNCITPGTEFMAKLQEQLKFFVVKKISSDKLWQGPKIYLSGHETPGEGEHKVMDFIRYQKSHQDYDPNTRHCLYGLDADLMMLGLSSHEPHFSLLREEVRFGGKNSQKQKRSNAAEETTFHLLHLTLFREYLDYEFGDLKGKLPFDYNLERIIDDWILMGFLVGNDFIPHLPNMHIHHDALPTLWKNYKEVLPTLDGYLHDGGTLNLSRFEKFMCKLSEVDFDAFADKFSDLKWLEGKSESKAAKDEANIRQRASVSSNDVGIPTANEFLALRNDGEEEEDLRAAMGAMTLEEFEEVEDDFMAEENAMLEKEFRSHKDAYYLNKMALTSSREVLQDQAENYVRAIQWILHYYFNGVPSWSWYYPYHYAPYLSDVCNFADMKINFDMSKPFLPFQQLMAVLPSASKNIIPKPLQTLMLDENSPVIDFYPADFELDLNGKQQEWEAVVLIPFIDEDRLLNGMSPLEDKLTDEEKARNKHGPHTLFYYDPKPQGVFQSSLIDKYPDSTVWNHHARICTIDKDLFRIPPEKIYKGLCLGVSLDVYYPGFPTLKHLPHTARLSKSGVKVFQQNSRGENTMLTLTHSEDEEEDVEQVAREYLGRSIYVSWPHMIEARVLAVADGCVKYSLVENNSRDQPDRKDIEKQQMDQDESRKWAREVSAIEDTYHDRKGVIIGETNILVYAAPMTGRKYVYKTNITLEKQWSSKPVAFALQATAKDIAVKDPSYRQYKTLEELFTPKTWVFMLGQPDYGCMGEILDVDPSNEGRVRVNFIKSVEPMLDGLVRTNDRVDKYQPGYIVSNKVGISSFMVSRFTGVLYISKGSKAHPPARDVHRTNVGLNLKFNKTSMEVPGFTKKSDIDNQWLYSNRVIQILHEYTRKFTELFEYIAASSDDNYYEDDIFGEEESADKVKALRDYLKSLPCAEVAPAEQGTRIVHEEVVEMIEHEVERALGNNRRKRIKMQVKPHLLYRSLDAQANSLPDPTTTYQLFDRVVNVREGYSVPLGVRGTVIGIRAAAKEQDILYEVMFDEEFLGGLTIRCKTNKAYRVPATALVNLTHGERKEEAKNSFKPTAVVKPQQGKPESFKPAWLQQKSGGHPWNQNQQPVQAQGGNNRGQQQLGRSASQMYERGSSHPYPTGNQQPRSSYQQQWRGNNSNTGIGNSMTQDYGYQGRAFGNSYQGYNGNEQQGGMAGGTSSSQQANLPPGRQTYHQMQQYQYSAQNQYSGGGRREDKQHTRHGEYTRESSRQAAEYSQETEDNEKYANVWKQLQGSTPQTWSDKGGSGNKNPQKPNRQQQTNQRYPQQQHQHPQRSGMPGQGGGPSLNDAAKALKESHFSSAPRNANNNRAVTNRSPVGHSRPENSAALSQSSQIQPEASQGTQPVDISQLFTKKQPESAAEKEDFNRLMAALNSDTGSQSTQQHPQSKSTAQEGTEALQQLLKVQGKPENSASNQRNTGAQSYGKQVSVQDLFKGAKNSSSDAKVTAKQGATLKTQTAKRNHVGALLDYCKSKRQLAPRYDYQYAKDGKLCCVVTMPDGEQFKGSYAKERQTAMDSAAYTALSNVSSSDASNAFNQKSSEESSDANFAMSPNSAFKAVKGTGPMGIEFQFSGTSGQNRDLFPRAPQQPFHHTQQQQHVQLHTRQEGSADQYHYGGQSDSQRYQGHQHKPHYHQKNNSHNQGYGYNNKQQYRHRGQGQQQAYEQNERGREHQEPGRRDNEKNKDNPFVPLQVFKKQKTPVKSDNRGSRGPDNGRTQEQPAPVTDQYQNTEEMEHQSSLGAAAADTTSSASRKQNQGPNTGKEKGSSRAHKERSPGTETTKKSQPRRPKSRLAAKFT